MVTATRANPADLWQLRQGKVAATLHPGQRLAYRSRHRFTWMVAGTQGGKTSFGPLWLLKTMRELGVGDYLAVTASFPLLVLKMLPEFLRLFQHTYGLGTWKASERTFALHDGSRVVFGSAQSPEALESATAKAAWLDECGQDQFKYQAYEAVLRRLVLHQGRILGTTTPYSLGWLKQQVYDRWRQGDTQHRVIQFPSVVNPIFPKKEYARARATLPAWRFGMFFGGRFTRPAGLIYEDYSDEPRDTGGHLVDDFDIPKDWPRYVGVDFGAVNTALVWLAHDVEHDHYYLYDEKLEGGKIAREHAEEALAQAKGLNVVSWWGGSASETQQRWEWHAHKVPLQAPPIDSVEIGIDRVTGMWRTHRLSVLQRCAGVRDELATYARKLNDQMLPTEDIKAKAEYHRLDALRYVVQAISERSGWFVA